ncbi:MAG TPA: hypothetical protein VGU02_07140 [Gaiellaceae bacterium]|nr:hypothetical protein [Gaiellaceae bacterium]
MDSDTPPLLATVHIQRTGGTTLENLLVRHFGRAHRKISWKNGWDDVIAQVRDAGGDPATRSIRGHFPFSLRRLLPQDTRFATFFRDPVRRIVSHYDLFQQHPNVAGIYGLPAVPQGVSLEEAVGSGEYFLDNVMTRMLSDAPSPFEEPTREHLAQAIRNLETFDVVGLTERYEESLVLFQRTFDLPFVMQPRANATQRSGAAEIPASTIELIRDRNLLDLELYAAALARFDELVATASTDPAFTFDVDVLRAAARGVPRLADRDAAVAIRALVLQAEFEQYERRQETTKLKSKLERLERRMQKRGQPSLKAALRMRFAGSRKRR